MSNIEDVEEDRHSRDVSYLLLSDDYCYLFKSDTDMRNTDS